MSKINDGDDGINRGRFLKSTGAAAIAASSLATVGSAKPSFEDIIDRAHRIREKTGSQAKFLKYLRKHDLAVANQRRHHTVPMQSDGPSTQNLSEGDLTTNLTLVYNYYQCSLDNIYTEYSWDWQVSSGSGESPVDYVSMGWPTDHYLYESETHGERVSHFDRDNDGGASVWEYDDTNLGGYLGDDSHSSYAGCYLNKSSTDQDRHVGAKYRHTWEDVELTGWSYTVGSEGETSWAPQFSTVEKIWNGGFEKIYESEAEYNYTNC